MTVLISWLKRIAFTRFGSMPSYSNLVLSYLCFEGCVPSLQPIAPHAHVAGAGCDVESTFSLGCFSTVRLCVF